MSVRLTVVQVLVHTARVLAVRLCAALRVGFVGDGDPRRTLRAAARRVGRSPRMVGDAGMSTAEYAVGTVAAVAFAAVLYKVVTSGTVLTALTHIIKSALTVSF